MQQPIHIACNIDSSYIQCSSVMLVSLCENNKNSLFIIHIISDTLNAEDKATLQKILAKYSLTLKFYSPDESILKACPPSNSHIPNIAYYRCFLSIILPQDIQKVLYLDGDMIIRGEINELWNTDISSYAIACVEDMWSLDEDNYKRLDYPSSYSYFNAGVLLINLDNWRKNNTNQTINQYLIQNGHKLIFNDQDVLNALFYDKKLFLPLRFNMQDGFFRRRRKIAERTWKELDEAILDPTILHYTGGKKPWHYKSLHPYKWEYFKYLDLTPWAGWRPKIDYKFLAIKQINLVLSFLKLLKSKYRKIENP